MAISLGSLTWSTSVNVQGLNSGLDEAQSKFQTTARSMRRIGTKMSQFITLPLAAIGGAAAKASGDFEASMNEMAAVGNFAANENSKAFQKIREEALRIGRDTEQSAQSAAEGFTSLLRRGFEVEQAMGAMSDTVDLAAAANTNLSKATDTVASTLNTLGVEASETEDIVDQMTAAVNNSGQNFDELSSGLQRTTGAASQFGVPLREVNAALSVLADQGLKGRRAGTSLKNMFTELVNKSNELGISVKNAQGELLPLSEIFQKINNSNVNIEEVFNKRALRAVRRLTGSSTERLEEMRKAMVNSGGAASKAAEKMRQGLNFAIKQVNASLNTLAIQLGDSGFNEFATEVGKSIKSVLDSIGALNPEILKFGSIFAGLLATVGPVIVIFTTLAAAMSPVTLAIGAVIGAVAALITFWDDLKATFQTGGLFAPVIKKAKDFFNTFKQSDVLKDWVEETKSIWNDLIQAGVTIFNKLKGAVTTIVNELVQTAVAFWNEFGDEIIKTSRRTYNVAVKLFKNLFAAIGGLVEIFSGLIRGDWEDVWNGIRDFTANIFQGLIRLSSTFVRNLVTMFAGMFESIGMGDFAANMESKINSTIKSVSGTLTGMFEDMKSEAGEQGEETGTDYVGELSGAVSDLSMFGLTDQSQSKEDAREQGEEDGKAYVSGRRSATGSAGSSAPEAPSIPQVTPEGKVIEPGDVKFPSFQEIMRENMKGEEGAKLASEAFKLPGIKGGILKLKEMQKAFKNNRTAARMMGQGLRKLNGIGAKAMSQLASTVGKGLGRIIAGTKGFEDLGKALLKQLASFMQTVASALISIGTAMAATGILSGSGAVYIGAGTALMAAATALSAGLSKDSGSSGSGGGGGTGQTAVGLAEGGVTLADGMAMLHSNEVVRDKKVDDNMFSKALNANTGGGGELRTRVRGEELEIILDRNKRRSNLAGL